MFMRYGLGATVNKRRVGRTPQGLSFFCAYMGISQNRGTILGMLIIRIMVYSGLYWF